MSEQLPSNLVADLRRLGYEGDERWQAAEEIERLTAELAEERRMHDEVDAALVAEVDERDRLRARAVAGEQVDS